MNVRAYFSRSRGSVSNGEWKTASYGDTGEFVVFTRHETE
jgi:hypothetical protein